MCLLSVGLFQSCSDKEALFKPVANNHLRAPAYPLVTIDPYTCAWSFTDNLYDEPVRHWTGKAHPDAKIVAQLIYDELRKLHCNIKNYKEI